MFNNQGSASLKKSIKPVFYTPPGLEQEKQKVAEREIAMCEKE